MDHQYSIHNKPSRTISKEDLLQQLQKSSQPAKAMPYSIESMNFFVKRPHRHVNFADHEPQNQQTIHTGNELSDELFQAHFGKPKVLDHFKMSHENLQKIKKKEELKAANKDICLKHLEKFSEKNDVESNPPVKKEKMEIQYNSKNLQKSPEKEGTSKKEIEIICPHLVQYFRRYEKKLCDENKTLKEYKLSTKKNQVTIKTPLRRSYAEDYFSKIDLTEKNQEKKWQNCLNQRIPRNDQNNDNLDTKRPCTQDIPFEMNNKNFQNSKCKASSGCQNKNCAKRQKTCNQNPKELLNKRNYDETFQWNAQGNQNPEKSINILDPQNFNEENPSFNWDMILKLNLKRDLYLDLNSKQFYLKLNPKDEDIVKATPKLYHGRLKPNLNLVPVENDVPSHFNGNNQYQQRFANPQRQFANVQQRNYNFSIQNQHANLNFNRFRDQAYMRRNSGFQKVETNMDTVRNFAIKRPQLDIEMSTTKLTNKKTQNQHIDITLNPGPIYVDPKSKQGLFRAPKNIAAADNLMTPGRRIGVPPIINPNQVQLVSTRPQNKQTSIENLQDLKIKQPDLPMDRLFQHSNDSNVHKELQKKSTAKKRRKTRKGCRCSKSKCLRLHCVCFKNGKFCSAECGCLNCYNSQQFSGLVAKVRSATKEINSQAFDSKCVEVKRSTGTFKLTKGCSCTKNNCLKNYCECRKLGLPCSTLCKCDHCYNDFVDLTPAEVSKLSRKVSRKKKKIVFQTKEFGKLQQISMPLQKNY